MSCKNSVQLKIENYLIEFMYLSVCCYVLKHVKMHLLNVGSIYLCQRKRAGFQEANERLWAGRFESFLLCQSYSPAR